MLKPTINFIHKLRVYLLVFIVIVFFYQIGLHPIELGKFVGARFSSAIGISTSVPENPFNKLALQLKERQQDLDDKEQELNRWEEDLDKRTNSNDILIFSIISFGIILLFILISVNFYLDYRRKQKK